MFQARREKLARLIKEMKWDATVLVPGPNLYYFTGLPFKPSERLMLILLTKEGEVFYLVPQVELSKVEEVAQENIFWYTDEQGPERALQQVKEKIGSIGTAGVEYGQMRVMEWKAAEAIGLSGMKDISSTIDSLRMVKDSAEIEYMEKAVSILEESLASTLKRVKAGVTELEAAAELEYEMRKRGSQGTPFGTIVASGYRGALPHGRAADKLISEGELVVIDFGSIFGGYVADMTRTVAIGEISEELKEIYQVLKEAQQAAVDVIQPGVTAHIVDETARKIIRDSGFGSYFTHRTGHGIGLSAHEEPYMMQNNELVLQPGMTFTVEPGIYLPGKGGVRIEDNLVVTETGHRNLMTFTKDLIVL